MGNATVTRTLSHALMVTNGIKKDVLASPLLNAKKCVLRVKSFQSSKCANASLFVSIRNSLQMTIFAEQQNHSTLGQPKKEKLVKASMKALESHTQNVLKIFNACKPQK